MVLFRYDLTNENRQRSRSLLSDVLCLKTQRSDLFLSPRLQHQEIAHGFVPEGTVEGGAAVDFLGDV